MPVFWPSARCISFWAATSAADSQMWAKRWTRPPMSALYAVASSGSVSANAYVAATALTDGSTIGWVDGSATRAPRSHTARSRPAPS